MNTTTPRLLYVNWKDSNIGKTYKVIVSSKESYKVTVIRRGEDYEPSFNGKVIFQREGEVHKPMLIDDSSRLELVKMNIYKISQDVMTGYDTFDSAVVVAENEEAARNTSPDDGTIYIGGKLHRNWEPSQLDFDGAWAINSSEVTVELIGVTILEPQVIVASFNAG